MFEKLNTILEENNLTFRTKEVDGQTQLNVKLNKHLTATVFLKEGKITKSFGKLSSHNPATGVWAMKLNYAFYYFIIIYLLLFILVYWFFGITKTSILLWIIYILAFSYSGWYQLKYHNTYRSFIALLKQI